MVTLKLLLLVSLVIAARRLYLDIRRNEELIYGAASVLAGGILAWIGLYLYSIYYG